MRLTRSQLSLSRILRSRRKSQFKSDLSWMKNTYRTLRQPVMSLRQFLEPFLLFLCQLFRTGMSSAGASRLELTSPLWRRAKSETKGYLTYSFRSSSMATGIIMPELLFSCVVIPLVCAHYLTDNPGGSIDTFSYPLSLWLGMAFHHTRGMQHLLHDLHGACQTQRTR